MSTLTPADALRLAINVLRDSAEARRMPSGLELQGAAADMHADAADLLESLLVDVSKFGVSGFECVWSVCLQRSSGGAKPDFVVARQSTFDYDETGF